MTEQAVELAWAAGFFDGEGCTFLAWNGPRCYPTLVINQAVDDDGGAECLERFRTALGDLGTVAGPYVKDRRNPKVKRQHQYRLGNWRHTVVALGLLWPYLSAPKRRQALQVLDGFSAARALNPRLGEQPHGPDGKCRFGHDLRFYSRPNGRGQRVCSICARKRSRTWATNHRAKGVAA